MDERLMTCCIDLREALSGRRTLARLLVVEPTRQEASPLELRSNPVGEDPPDQEGRTKGSTRGSQAAGEEGNAPIQLRRAGVTLAQLGTAPPAPETSTCASDGEGGEKGD